MTKHKALLVKRNSQMIKAGGLYTIGNFALKGLAFFLLPVYTRLLDTTEYGIVSTFTSVSNLSYVFVGFAMMTTVRSAYTDFRDDIYSYLSSLFAISFCNTAAAAVIVPVFIRGHISIEKGLFYSCMIVALGTSVSNCMSQFLMMREAYIVRTLYMVIPNLFFQFTGIVLLLTTNIPGHIARIIPMVAANLGLIVFSCLYIGRKRKRILSLQYIKYAYRIAFPLFFEAVAYDLLASSDVIMITYFKSAADSAVYNVTYTLSMVGISVTSAVQGVWIPWFTRNTGNKTKIKKYLKIYIDIGLSVTIGVLMLAPEILRWFTSTDYSKGIYYVIPIGTAALLMFLCTAACDFEYYHKAFNRIAVNTVTAAAVNVILNFLLIPVYGALAAAYTTLISYAVSLVIHTLNAKKCSDGCFGFYVLLKPLFITCFVCCLYVIFIKMFYIRWLAAFLFVIAIWGTDYYKLRPDSVQ